MIKGSFIPTGVLLSCALMLTPTATAWADSVDAYGVESVLKPVLRARDFVAPVMIGVITAVLSSFWPALRAARAKPADALRQV